MATIATASIPAGRLSDPGGRPSFIEMFVPDGKLLLSPVQTKTLSISR
jgi:hypothetical protein